MSVWHTQHLGELLDEAKSGFACGDDPADGMFQFRMNNITTEGQIDLTKKRRVPRHTKNLDSYLLEPGDVLFNATNSPDLVGKSAHVTALPELAVFSNHFLRLRPSPNKLEGRFLARWLNTQFHRRTFQGMCRQWVNQATVGRESLLALAIPVPPLFEQRRIAEVLDRAEALRAKRRAALALLDTLAQSIFVDLFGDESDRWPMRPVADYVARFEGGKSFQADSDDEARATYRILKISAVTSMEFVPSESKPVPDGYLPEREHLVRAGDLLFSRANTADLVGAVAHVEAAPPNLLLPDKLWRFVWTEPRLVDPHFVWALFQSVPVRRELARRATGTSGSMKNISQEKLMGIRTILPPLLLQKEFARRLASINTLKATHRASLAQLDALFASLQHRAFRGEL